MNQVKIEHPAVLIVYLSESCVEKLPVFRYVIRKKAKHIEHTEGNCFDWNMHQKIISRISDFTCIEQNRFKLLIQIEQSAERTDSNCTFSIFIKTIAFALINIFSKAINIGTCHRIHAHNSNGLLLAYKTSKKMYVYIQTSGQYWTLLSLILDILNHSRDENRWEK